MPSTTATSRPSFRAGIGSRSSRRSSTTLVGQSQRLGGEASRPLAGEPQTPAASLERTLGPLPDRIPPWSRASGASLERRHAPCSPGRHGHAPRPRHLPDRARRGAGPRLHPSDRSARGLARMPPAGVAGTRPEWAATVATPYARCQRHAHAAGPMTARTEHAPRMSGIGMPPGPSGSSRLYS
jgi:hypothetical protein